MLETAGVDAADVLVAKENPVPKEAVDAVLDAVLPTPNPAKDDPPLAEEAAPVEAAGIADKDEEALAGAVEAVAPNAGTEDDKEVPLVARVDAVVVVTVENSGADAMVNEKEPGVPETAEADEAEDEAALENPKEG